MPEAFHPKRFRRDHRLLLLFRSEVLGGTAAVVLGLLWSVEAIGLGNGHGAFGVGVGLAYAVAGLFLIRYGVREAMRRHRILASGIRATATVTRIHRSASLRHPRHHIDFTFRDSSGEVHQASSGPVAPRETRGLSTGGEGRVAYDPADPKQVVWIGRDGL